MIGIANFKSTLPEEFDARILIYGESFPSMSMKELNKINEDLMAAAEALGDEPDTVPPNYKEHGLCLQMAILEHSEGPDQPISHKLLPENWRSTKEIGNIKLLTYNHMPLPWVYDYSKGLQKEGKQFGYNFQKIGAVGPISNIKAIKKFLGYMHPNPNVAKDWDNNVSASEVDDNDEMYADLLAQEKARNLEWLDVVAQWKELGEQEAYEELQEGIARRLCLRSASNKLLLPEVGMVFHTRIVMKDSKYPEVVSFRYDKEGSYIYTKEGFTTFPDVNLLAEVIRQKVKK